MKSSQKENRALRQALVHIQAKVEQEEEFVSNTLLKIVLVLWLFVKSVVTKSLLNFKSVQLNMSDLPIETPPKSKRKKRHEVIGYFFGQPLESFGNILEAQPSTSTAATQNHIKPTDLNIVQHWMYLEGQKKPSNSVNEVTDNLIEFYTKYHTSVELR